MYRKIKKRVFEIINTAKEGDVPSKVCDIFFITLILINVVIVIADTFEIDQATRDILSIIETVSVIVFSIEYLLRLWTADYVFPNLGVISSRIRYIFTIAAMVDLIAILPFYLPFLSSNLIILRIFRVFRLLRLFKVNRYTNALKTIGQVFKDKAHQLIASIAVVMLLMVIASVLMYNVEHDVQPEVFDNALSGLWWAVATLTTVGYGDIYPITALGKLFSAVIALLGIGLVAVPTGIITAGFSEQINKSEEEKDEKSFCPYCGKKIK